MTDHIYEQLQVLAATVPTFESEAQTHEEQMWLAQVRAALLSLNDPLNGGSFDAAVHMLQMADQLYRPTARTQVTQCMFNALAQAGQNRPAAVRGAFLPAQSPHDALVAVRKVTEAAKVSVLFVDPYADATLLDTYAIQMREQVQVLLLADAGSVKPSLKPAGIAWVSQYAATRPLEIRLAPARALHDRMIVVDNNDAWVVGQSFNALAVRAPTSIAKLDIETARMKIDAHIALWHLAVPI